MVTVFSLSVSAWVGTPPSARRVESMHEISVPWVRSHVGITTR